MNTTYPTGDELRSALLARATQFSEQTGTTPSAIGKRSVNDPAFLPRLAQGRNFTVATYDRAMEWLNRNWPAAGSSLRSSKLAVNLTSSRATYMSG